jgi:uncharacterized protein YdeI (YjbR/CyaY-like superfamily)
MIYPGDFHLQLELLCPDKITFLILIAILLLFAYHLFFYLNSYKFTQMLKTNPEIDAYILKAKPFAQAIFKHYRKLVHKACPDIEEKTKWGFPHFDYNGQMMCNMAAFKQHCAFGFWKATWMKDSKKFAEAQGNSMGHLDRITDLQDLPADKVLISYIKEAMKLNDMGVKLPARKKILHAKELIVPDDFKTALTKNIQAAEHFENFPPGKKKEYIVWVTEAKREETRHKRIETAIEWISEGKIRNWKYVKK